MTRYGNPLVNVRLTPDERAKLAKIQEKYGNMSVSDAIRLAIDVAHGRLLAPPKRRPEKSAKGG